jgi:hypothetical protein
MILQSSNFYTSQFVPAHESLFVKFSETVEGGSWTQLLKIKITSYVKNKANKHVKFIIP